MGHVWAESVSCLLVFNTGNVHAIKHTLTWRNQKYGPLLEVECYRYCCCHHSIQSLPEDCSTRQSSMHSMPFCRQNSGPTFHTATDLGQSRLQILHKQRTLPRFSMRASTRKVMSLPFLPIILGKVSFVKHIPLAQELRLDRVQDLEAS